MVVARVDDAAFRGDPLGDLVHVARGWQPGSDVMIAGPSAGWLSQAMSGVGKLLTVVSGASLVQATLLIGPVDA
jgi:hypothetical protein